MFESTRVEIKKQERFVTQDLDGDGVHLHAGHTLQVENVFARIVPVDILHRHSGVRFGGLNEDALAVFEVAVHLGPNDLRRRVTLDCRVKLHGGAGTQLQALLQLSTQLCLRGDYEFIKSKARTSLPLLNPLEFI